MAGLVGRIRGSFERIRGENTAENSRIYGKFRDLQIQSVQSDIRLQFEMFEENTQMFKVNYELAKIPGNNVPFKMIESQLASNAGALSAYEDAGALPDDIKSRLSVSLLYGQLKAFGSKNEPAHICDSYKHSKDIVSAGLSLQGLDRSMMHTARRLPDLPGSEYGSVDDEYGY